MASGKPPPRKFIDLLRGENWAWKEKCVYERKCKGKNTCRVFLRRKASWKTQNGSWLVCAGEKTGREEKLASGKNHSVGVEKEKQARKPTPEAY